MKISCLDTMSWAFSLTLGFIRLYNAAFFHLYMKERKKAKIIITGYHMLVATDLSIYNFYEADSSIPFPIYLLSWSWAF